MPSIEWDLIMMDSLENLFSHIPRTALGCTGLISLKYIESSWYWLADEKMKQEWHTFYNSVAGFSQIKHETVFAIQGPALVIPRAFLHNLANVPIPGISNDELRIPLYAQLFNIQLVDNELFKWGMKNQPTALTATSSRLIY